MKQTSARLFANLLIALILSVYCQPAATQQWAAVAGIEGQDIGIGKNGVVWATAKSGAIYRWTGSAWETMPGGASRIAVDPQGGAWVVNGADDIYRYNLSSKDWEMKTGKAKDIGVGADGSVWIIGTNAVPGGYDIYKWNGSGWNLIPGGAVRIAVDPSGNAWIINNTNSVFAYNGASFVQKPGGLKDIGIGANGSVWSTAPDGKIYKWDGSTWKQQSGGAYEISVAPDGNAWVVNGVGQVWRTTNAGTIRAFFPRNQVHEFHMLQALKIFPYTNMISGGGTSAQFANIDPLGQALGKLSLTAAEILFNGNRSMTHDEAINLVRNQNNTRQQLNGILSMLIMDELNKRGTDPASVALNQWSTALYRSLKVRTAKAILDEYKKWKNDHCSYEGLTATQCRGKYGVSNLLSPQKPPLDTITKMGLGAALGTGKDEVALAASLGITSIAATASAIALVTSVSTTAAASAGAGAGYGGILLVTTQTGLFGAFGGTSVVTSAGFQTVASGAIGASGWAGVIAAPIAAAIMAIVVGTVEGIAVVEAAKVEPMLKMKLGAAMTEDINMANVVNSDDASMFFIALEEAAVKAHAITDPKVDGEVRFYCQAGYVSIFKLRYTLDGQEKVFVTPELSVGYERSFPIPYNAKNIRVQGFYASGDWKELFNQTLARPTHICYTSYGTLFGPSYKTDCPEVGSMTTSSKQLTVTQGGAYMAWVRLTYTENGEIKTALDKSDAGGGWRKVFDIPAAATGIRLEVWSSTGLAWEPWKSIIDKTWPYPPNECIKVYNTTLDPKWNNECN